MSWFDTVFLSVVTIFVAYSVFIAVCEEYNLLVSFRMLPKKKFKQWEEQRKKKRKTRKKRRKERSEDWREWWKHLSTLRRTYFVLTVIVSPIFIGSFLLIFPQFLIKIYDDATSFYNLSLAVFAILSGLGAVFGFYTSIIRTETAEQGQITERINKAVEGIGKNNEDGKAVTEVRLGALYALERIAQDSIRDHVQIMEILCAYVRHNCPKEQKIEDVIESLKNKKIKTITKSINEPLREDIQAAISIIGRRKKWSEGKKRLQKESEMQYHIQMHYCNLDNVELPNATLCGAGFIGVNLSNAVLIGADISDAWISFANMNDALLGGMEMKGTITRGAYAYECDFSECINLTQHQLDLMYCGIDVEIPTMDRKNKITRPKHWPKTRLSYNVFIKRYIKWLEQNTGKLF